MEKRKKAGMKWLAMWVAVSVFFMTQATAVFAGQEGRGNEGRTAPSNPVYHETTDTTDWSYVYFGSYPQTEVIGAALNSAIKNASYDENGDAWVNGNKYRRISIEDTNFSGFFGESEYRYFKWEQMKWRVLENDGSTLFVVSDVGIDCKNYNQEDGPTTWESCTLREWLNTSFYTSAFDSDEQDAIVECDVANQGNHTTDRLYLLSFEDVTNPAYGFCDNSSTLSKSRQIKTSNFAHTRGVYLFGNEYGTNCCWSLRTPGQYENYVMGINYNGLVGKNGGKANTDYYAIVPALRLDISSDAWSVPGGGDAQETPQNPVYDELTDTTEWSYVYFGSYPQTEVTGKELTSAIIKASYDESGDAWVGGVKYRRIGKKDTNHGDYFGNSTYRYFKWERIKWRVLYNDGSTLFVAADKGLDCKNYNTESETVTWESSALRSWLNDSFFHTAFSRNEQEAIVSKDVVNEDNPVYDASGENDTRDNIYLLSVGEVTDTTYGFCQQEFVDSASRQRKVSDYAHVRGATIDVFEMDGDNCGWWLRTSGSKDTEAGVVIDGYVFSDSVDVGTTDVSVLPAMHIRLSSDRWYLTDDGGSGEGGSSNLSDPVHSCTKDYDSTGNSDITNWGYVYFGSYPQTEVTGAALSKAIVNASYNENGDAWVNGVKYRRLRKSDTNYNEYFGEKEYRYFKWERIRWRILKKNSDTLFLMADKGLDCKCYNDKRIPVTWESCSLRGWLNEEFYSTAFSVDEQNVILRQDVVNQENPIFGTNGGNQTKDKIYLPSFEEMTNETYGFCPDMNHYSASRRLWPSDYAHVRGALGYYTDSTTTDGYDGCVWWLRTPGEGTSFAMEGRIDGNIYSSAYVSYLNVSVAPVLHIDLKSAVWYLADDGTSGEGGSKNDSGEKPEPITIVGNPLEQNVKVGETATFGIEVKGGSPSNYTYQWYYSASLTGEGMEIPGADSFLYVILSVNPENGGYYYCRVSDGTYSAESKRAQLVPQKASEPNPDKPSENPPGQGVGSGDQNGDQITENSWLWVPQLKVKLVSSNAVKLSWSKVKGATYDIYRSTSKKGTYRKIKTVSKNSYTNKGLKSGKTYYYKIALRWRNKTSKLSNVASKKIIGKPVTPKQNRIVIKPGGKFTISWKKTKKAQKIEIQRSVNGGKYKKWKTVSAKKRSVSYSYLSFPRKRKYSFRLRSYYKKDGIKIYSGYSNAYAILR